MALSYEEKLEYVKKYWLDKFNIVGGELKGHWWPWFMWSGDTNNLTPEQVDRAIEEIEILKRDRDMCNKILWWGK